MTTNGHKKTQVVGRQKYFIVLIAFVSGMVLAYNLRDFVVDPKFWTSINYCQTQGTTYRTVLRKFQTQRTTSHTVFHDFNKVPYYYKPVVSRNNDKYRKKFTYNHTWSDVRKLAGDKRKVILFYNPPGWIELGFCTIGIEKCPIKSCTCLKGRGQKAEADAMIINMVDFAESKLPRRYPNQVWISYGLESPVHYHKAGRFYEKWSHNVFNWTMTYHLDSDVVLPYDVIIRLDDVPNRNFTEITLRKSRSAAWMVSNCGAPSKRGEYVKELQKHYTVDVYGNCGHFSCKRSQESTCNKLLEEKYYFYLSFENSLCEDYITEKLFKTYGLDIVPVVRGRADYDSMIPPGTYINTADFNSTQELAEYLRYLECNVTAYSEILRRKSQYLNSQAAQKTSPIQSAFCDICMKLHNLDKYENSYNDYSRWLRENMCHPPKKGY